MPFKRKFKILAIVLTTTFSAWLLAETQPVANGSSLGSTRASSEVTTMQPMDPARDSSAGITSRTNRRAMSTTSGTAVPDSTTTPRY